ncbi:hypothetical protein AOL_s00007g399 [Orbilia oligospora ATCC 24927]|uniref:Uncharacterized protein n=1 Tax=Arthrobotrys oligospora (strain ATCC 24927 / CBS 115.81 / DSM 1491) TaxID=756982 RepID=G1X290_ARTOA|nr:hypothetical protein AOL_s00007g399 [Orbilia oligospora ATCC 24927]EGX52616.1 hypothetical protein AOL_s00007g399 [Orbilia oligospora ATCC 24927]
MTDSAEITLDLIAHPNQPPSSSSSPPSSSSSSLTPPPSLLSEKRELPTLSPVPIKRLSITPVLDPILASASLDSQVFSETLHSPDSPGDLPHKRARHHTIDSIPSSTEMDGPSTAATSPQPPEAEEVAQKLDKGKTPLSSSEQPALVEVATTNAAAAASPQPEPTQLASASTRRAASSRSPNNLNKPKTEHLEYFLNSLPSGSSSLGVEQMESRQQSPGRVPAAVHALEEAHKRNSQCSDRASIRKSLESRHPDVTSHPIAAKTPVQSIGAPPPAPPVPVPPMDSIELARPETASSVSPAVGSNITIQTPNSQNGKGGKKNGLRSILNKIRSHSNHAAKQAPVVGIGRQETDSTVQTSSTPISAISANRFQEPQVAPMVDGVDARNDATYYRDLKRDFENRRLRGTHEHPVEGAMALSHGTGITSMGLKQLFRSISRAVRSSTHGLKKLVLRRAKQLPDQISATVRGQPQPELPASKRAQTRAQRQSEYEQLTKGPLPTFGARVPTPPPVIPLIRNPSAEVVPTLATASSSRSATSSPYSTPHYRQIGLFASQPHEIAAKLSEKGKAASHLTNGDATPSNLQNGEGHSSNPQLSSSSSSQSAGAALNGSKGVSASQPATNPNAAGQAPSTVKKDAAGGFFREAFHGW